MDQVGGPGAPQGNWAGRRALAALPAVRDDGRKKKGEAAVPPLLVPVVSLRRGGAGVIGRSPLGAARHRVQRDLVRHLGGDPRRLAPVLFPSSPLVTAPPPPPARCLRDP